MSETPQKRFGERVESVLGTGYASLPICSFWAMRCPVKMRESTIPVTCFKESGLLLVIHGKSLSTPGKLQ